MYKESSTGEISMIVAPWFIWTKKLRISRNLSKSVTEMFIL